MDIKQTREQLGMTQAQFGKRLGVSERTIQNWEWGNTSPKPHHVKAIEQMVAEGEPVTVQRLIAIIESQQRVIETLTRAGT
jgi:DNA-binding transcriptional regulator YiaG